MRLARVHHRLAATLAALACAPACGVSLPPAGDAARDALADTAPARDARADAPAAPDDASSDAPAPPPPDAPAPDAPVAPVHGLRGEYFDRYDDPRAVRTDEAIDFTWAAGTGPLAGVGSDFFSVRWTGEIDARFSETYTFETRSDDGVRLWIDDRVVLQNWTGHFPTTDRGTVMLTAGRHRVRLEYFELDMGATLQLFWSSPSQPRELVPSAQLYPSAAASTARPPRPDFSNPVFPTDCPDPGVIRVDEGARPMFYMVCTGGSFPIRRSRDLVTWEGTGAAIIPGGRAPWSANGGRNWAPEIHRVRDRYVAYFTAVNSRDQLAIGAATAMSPTGPWTVTSAPLIDDPTPGVIDATYFADSDGRHYLYWKVDGNAVGRPTPIYVQELRSDGLGFAPGSARTQVLTNNSATWEGGVVEAPWVVRHGAYYYLFYSGNVYDGRYRTGVARATSPRGPFTKRGAPILANNAAFVGPGHGSVVSLHGAEWFVYHAWRNNGAGGAATSTGRNVLLERIVWGADDWPRLGDGTPTRAPQAWP